MFALDYASATGAVDDAAFRAAAGVGFEISEAEVGAEVDTIIAAQKEDIAKNLYPFQGRVLGMTKKHPKLKFADAKFVTDAVEVGFLKILGPRTAENEKKAKAPKKGKEKGGGGGGGDTADKGTAPVVAEGVAAPAAQAAEQTEALSAKAEEEARKLKADLLTEVALAFDLDVGAVFAKFLKESKGGGDTTDGESVLNPIEVSGEIDYTKLIEQFGTENISAAQIARIEKITGKPAHPFLTRGIFFSHRDLDQILDAKERGETFYLYTGRGPSSDSMHLGHLIPFMFTQYLQEAFGCNLVIQMTDDEKYLWKDLTLAKLRHTLIENVKDIIACGFDREKTFIFSDLGYMGGKFYENILRMEKRMTGNMAMNALGLKTTDNIGRFQWSAIQAAPSFSSSFPHMFGPDSNVQCLIPCAIDQDVYFRMTRDIAPRLRVGDEVTGESYKKPAVIHSSFFPAIDGAGTKMSSSVFADKTVFLTDTAEDIKTKIFKFAFSGARGSGSLKDLQALGADLDKDVPYQYLRFFQHDDAKLKDIGDRYSAGKMSTKAIKDELVTCLQDLVLGHQTARTKVSQADVDYFMSTDPARFQGGAASASAPAATATVVAFATPPAAYMTHDDDASIGKPAPAIDTAEYVKGDPIKLGGGKVSVVTFFAKFAKGDYTTIVGVNKLAAAFPDVSFVGLSIDPDKGDAEGFLKKLGTAMPEIYIDSLDVSYPLAWDNGKAVKEAYRKAAGMMSLGASACFVVDGAGTIVWREQFGQGHAPHQGQLGEQIRRTVAGEELLKNGPKPTEEVEEEEELDMGGADDYDSDLGF